uniref:Aromatic-L-amino-acid decarboxylase n=1 Tax=Macrostomum lignano TaxID=282301 RepID=A0A1I8HY23_9PLAT
MDGEEFRQRGRQMVDLIVDYVNSFRDRPVVPNVQPGYLRPLIPPEAPQEGESFDKILADIEPVVLAGVTNWHHPNFHAYYPTASSYPAILGDMLSDAIACIGFSWIASPACTELETVMMDWLAKALGLPDHFLFSSGGRGGGVIQGTASEASLMVFLGARNDAIAKLQAAEPQGEPCELLARLVAYTSEEAHSSVERAAKLAFVRIRSLKTDEKHSLRGDALKQAIAEDRAKGLVPILCIATLGTTSSCAFDNVRELGQICNREGLWCHVDAAYAGSALLCPELRNFADGIELADSFNFNPHKWMLVTFDCSALFLRDASKIVEIFSADPIYLKHEFTGQPDYRHWQIPLGRRFRSLKIWFVMRCFGISGLQAYIRKHVSLAKEFEALILADGRFEVVEEVTLGLVCFRLKGTNEATEALYRTLREDQRIHLVASKFHSSGVYFLRFVVCSSQCESKDIRFAHSVIMEAANKLANRRSDRRADCRCEN